MLTVVWYSLFGRQLTDEEVEREVREKIAAKEQRKEKLLGVFKKSS
jgi:hypothetical protein